MKFYFFVKQSLIIEATKGWGSGAQLRNTGMPRAKAGLFHPHRVAAFGQMQLVARRRSIAPSPPIVRDRERYYDF